MRIKIYRKVPHPDGPVMGYKHPRWLMIELGKHWEIYVTRTMAEHLWNDPRQPPNLYKDKFFIKKLKEGEIIPFWYGFARYDFETDTSAYMPIPLNLIAAAWHWFKMHVLMDIKYRLPHKLVTERREIRDCITILDHLDNAFTQESGYHADIVNIRYILNRLRGL